MSILNQPLGMKQFFERYVQNPGDIELDATLAPYGLRVSKPGSFELGFSLTRG